MMASLSTKISQTTISGLHQISLPVPYQIGDVNVFLAEGDPLTLIDCGVRGEKTKAVLGQSLAALGYALSDIQRLIITHHHADHLGFAQELVSLSGAKVWAHPMCVKFLQTPKEALEGRIRYAGLLFQHYGVPQEIQERMAIFWRAVERTPAPVLVAKTLDEGDHFDLLGRHWRVYHTPGHAGDLLCFYEPESRVLLSSDHLLLDVSSNPLIEDPEIPGGPRPQRLIDYVREMQRIAELDIAVAYTGHGEPITDVRQLVETRLAFHKKRSAKLLAFFTDSQPRLLYELTMALFPHIHDAQLYLTFSETLGHLDLLVAEGHLRVVEEGGPAAWALP
jgi:glyoxylase-like metal-dependent hydrolase (beta-lactamase superfamily II)